MFQQFFNPHKTTKALSLQLWTQEIKKTTATQQQQNAPYSVQPYEIDVFIGKKWPSITISYDSTKIIQWVYQQ